MGPLVPLLVTLCTALTGIPPLQWLLRIASEADYHRLQGSDAQLQRTLGMGWDAMGCVMLSHRFTVLLGSAAARAYRLCWPPLRPVVLVALEATPSRLVCREATSLSCSSSMKSRMMVMSAFRRSSMPLLIFTNSSFTSSSQLVSSPSNSSSRPLSSANLEVRLAFCSLRATFCCSLLCSCSCTEAAVPVSPPACPPSSAKAVCIVSSAVCSSMISPLALPRLVIRPMHRNRSRSATMKSCSGGMESTKCLARTRER
mmetsp:Transcript_18874/g.52653  ORF Transcript_18874/g.52653 Transcript_18874/m.52653 type:complete len:257 (-) Transcript_18874:168-938(-)